MPHGPLLNLMEWHRFSPDAPGEFVGSIKLPTRTLQFAPITFDVSFQEIFSTWADGGTLVLVSDSQRIDLAALLAHIARHEVERLFLPVVALQQLAEAVSDGAPAPKSCKDIITAGEALRITPAIQRLFALLPECILHNHYGPSETHVVTSYKLQGTPQTWPNYPPIGKPIWNVSANLADVDGSPVKPGSDGELYLGGACLADGYIGRPDLTVERFLTIGGKTDRVYKTGDHVREDENGDLVFVGRVDQQLKIRGYRVEPGEIEERLRKHEQVANAAVVGKSYGEGDTTLIAYYVAGPGSNPSPAELRSFLRQALPDYMIPSSFTRVDQMPLTSSGKLDRKALEDRTPTRQKEAPARNAVRAGSQLDEDIARLWKEALHTTEIGYDDNFFEVGGTSVQIIRLHRQLKQDLNCDFPITILFEHPTINALTIYLRSSVSGADSNNTDVGQSEGATVINRLRQFRKL
jgi:acyl-coenzyme A synthetase/AMP-(fatty) acid ligase/aryl carrier-like protein